MARCASWRATCPRLVQAAELPLACPARWTCPARPSPASAWPKPPPRTRPAAGPPACLASAACPALSCLPQEQYEALAEGIAQEQRLRARIAELQDYRAMVSVCMRCGAAS